MIGNILISLALQTIGLIAINVLYFGVLSDFSLSRWVCWAYIHLTYILIIAAMYSSKTAKNGNVYAYPKIMTATIYYVVSLIVGVILIAINFKSIVVPILTFLILTGIHLKVYLVLMATESHSIANEERDRRHMHFIKKLSERLSMLRNGVNDFKARKVVDKVYDAVRCAIVTSNPEVAMIENEIEEAIDSLERAIHLGSMVELESCSKKVVECVRKRDATLRLSC